MKRCLIVIAILAVLVSCKREDIELQPPPVKYLTNYRFLVYDSVFTHVITYPPSGGPSSSSVSFSKNYLLDLDSGMSADGKPYWIKGTDTFVVYNNNNNYICRPPNSLGNVAFADFKGDSLTLSLGLAFWQSWQDWAVIHAVRR